MVFNSKQKHRFSYKWHLTDEYPAKGIKHHDCKVFSTFACGGGSTMGYKLAGYNVIGASDIDAKMAGVYKINHNPEIYYLCDIRELNKKIINKEVEKRLFELDILDGSPPCSTFSMAGKREKSWNKEKKFREGQVKQKLDDLFFHFIETAKLLQPKIVIVENVKGLIQGHAKGYVKEIMYGFEQAGYDMQLFLLNAASMGVPQRRERVFFIGYRRGLKFNKLKLKFNEKSIAFKEYKDERGVQHKGKYANLLQQRNHKHKSIADIQGINSGFNHRIIWDNQVCDTLPSSGIWYRGNDGLKFTKNDLILTSSFPLDFNFLTSNVQYVVGMSVPPVMMAQIAHQVYLQWLQN